MKVWILQVHRGKLSDDEIESEICNIGIPLIGVFSSIGRLWDCVIDEDEIRYGREVWETVGWERSAYNDEYITGWSEDYGEEFVIYTAEVDDPA